MEKQKLNDKQVAKLYFEKYAKLEKELIKLAKQKINLHSIIIVSNQLDIVSNQLEINKQIDIIEVSEDKIRKEMENILNERDENYISIIIKLSTEINENYKKMIDYTPYDLFFNLLKEKAFEKDDSNDETYQLNIDFLGESEKNVNVIKILDLWSGYRKSSLKVENFIKILNSLLINELTKEKIYLRNFNLIKFLYYLCECITVYFLFIDQIIKMNKKTVMINDLTKISIGKDDFIKYIKHIKKEYTEDSITYCLVKLKEIRDALEHPFNIFPFKKEELSQSRIIDVHLINEKKFNNQFNDKENQKFRYLDKSTQKNKDVLIIKIPHESSYWIHIEKRCLKNGKWKITLNKEKEVCSSTYEDIPFSNVFILDLLVQNLVYMNKEIKKRQPLIEKYSTKRRKDKIWKGAKNCNCADKNCDFNHKLCEICNKKMVYENYLEWDNWNYGKKILKKFWNIGCDIPNDNVFYSKVKIRTLKSFVFHIECNSQDCNAINSQHPRLI